MINFVTKTMLRIMMRKRLSESLPVRVLEKDGHAVTLLGMRHLSLPAQFTGQVSMINEYDRDAVLLEGVNLESHPRKGDIDEFYGTFVDVISVPFVRVALQKDYLTRDMGMHADVSLDDPAYSAELDKTVDMLLQMKNLLAALRDGDSIIGMELESISDSGLEDFMLGTRNEVLVENIRESNEKKIICPWGSAHIPGIQELLENDGWVLTETGTVNKRGEIRMETVSGL